MTQQQLNLAPAHNTLHCQNCEHSVTGDQPHRTGLCWVRNRGTSSLRWNASTAANCKKYKETSAQ